MELIHYIMGRLYDLMVYPENQAGGIGRCSYLVDETNKKFTFITESYGCNYNAPYIPDFKSEDFYLNFLRNKGWNVDIIKIT